MTDYAIMKGTAEDYQDIIDFGNYVFGIDFPKVLPKLYDDHSNCAKYHHLIKEGHRIKAMVGSFPLGMKVLNHELKVYGIGTVSVHRYSRGTGYMKLLMDNAVEEIQSLDCDMAVLGGQRQRYEYWGFTPAGITVNMTFNQANVKHTKVDTHIPYVFEKYDEKNAVDLDEACRLHNTQPVHGIREKENFIEIAGTWENQVIFIYEQQKFIGYMCASSNLENISEIVLKHPADIDKIIVAFMKHYALGSLSVGMYLHKTVEFNKLRQLCEHFSINSNTNILIVNYPKVIKAFMDLKNSYDPLKEGTLVLQIEEKGCCKIEVKDGAVAVEWTDEPHDISLTHFEAAARLFSHAGLITDSLENPLVKSWFPLPMVFPGNDNV